MSARLHKRMNSGHFQKSFFLPSWKFLSVAVLVVLWSLPRLSASDVFWVASILVSPEIPEKFAPELLPFRPALEEAFPNQKITLLEVKKKSAIPGETRPFLLTENATLEIACIHRFPTCYSTEIRFRQNGNSSFVARLELSKKIPLLIRGEPRGNGRLFYLLVIR